MGKLRLVVCSNMIQRNAASNESRNSVGIRPPVYFWTKGGPSFLILAIDDDGGFLATPHGNTAIGIFGVAAGGPRAPQRELVFFFSLRQPEIATFKLGLSFE